MFYRAPTVCQARLQAPHVCTLVLQAHVGSGQLPLIIWKECRLQELLETLEFTVAPGFLINGREFKTTSALTCL